MTELSVFEEVTRPIPDGPCFLVDLVRLLTFSAVILPVAIALSAHAEPTADQVNLGEVRPGVTITSHLHVTNDGTKAITLLRQESALGEVKVKGLPATIPAHGQLDREMVVQPSRYLGWQTYSVDLATSWRETSVRAAVRLFVDSGIEGEPRRVDFGIVQSGTSGIQRVPFDSEDFPDIRALGTVDKQNMVHGIVLDAGKTLQLETRKDAGWGIHEGWIEIKTDSRAQPKAWIQYRFEVRGRVVPESYDINAGLQSVGNVHSESLFIRDVKGGQLRLGPISQVGSRVHLSKGSCPINDKSCSSVTIGIDDRSQKPGAFLTVLSIPLPEYGQTLHVRYSGLLISKDTVVRNLNAAGAGQSDSATTSNLGSELKSVTSQQRAPIFVRPPPGEGPLIKWTVENERQIYGYIVYRAGSESGPVRRLNASIIRSLSEDNGVTVHYAWRDTTAESGHPYWYKVGTVDIHDVRKDLTGMLKDSFGKSVAK